MRISDWSSDVCSSDLGRPSSSSVTDTFQPFGVGAVYSWILASPISGSARVLIFTVCKLNAAARSSAATTQDPCHAECLVLSRRRTGAQLQIANRRTHCRIARSARPSARQSRTGTPIRGDRKSVVEGKSVSVRVDLGGRRIINKKKNIDHKKNKKIRK